MEAEHLKIQITLNSPVKQLNLSLTPKKKNSLTGKISTRVVNMSATVFGSKVW